MVGAQSTKVDGMNMSILGPSPAGEAQTQGVQQVSLRQGVKHGGHTISLPQSSHHSPHTMEMPAHTQTPASW